MTAKLTPDSAAVTSRTIPYKWAALVGGIVWTILGLTFGEWLLNHSMAWSDPTASQQAAGIGFMILALPFALVLAAIEGKLLITFFLNGALWGLAVALVFNKISARRRANRNRPPD